MRRRILTGYDNPKMWSTSSSEETQSTVKPDGDVGTKTIQLQEGDDSKTAIIGVGLSDK